MKRSSKFIMSVAGLLLIVTLTSQAQRTTTHTDETSNNTTGCATPTASYVGTTSCQANFPGANDNGSAGTDQNAGANTVTFDAVPQNLADFSHDNVDIHKLVYNGFGVTDSGKVFTNIVLWHAGSPFNYTPKSPGPENTKNGHFVVGYSSDDANQVAAQLAYMKRLKIDGIVGNPPGPLPLSLPSQDTTGQTKNHDTNQAMETWKTKIDNDSSGFLYSIMTDQVMWDQNTICTGSGMHPDCVEKVMTCSLDYMATPTTSNFTCVLDGNSYAGGGYFSDSHYWKVNSQPVMSYFLDEANFFGSCNGCAVYNNNVTGVTCTGSSDCWQKIYEGIAHHISSFSPKPIVINRDNFTHLPTDLNGGSFRWFNPTTDQNNQDLTAYDTWLNTASSTSPTVALAVGLGKVDHAQSPFPSQSGANADHFIMDAKCGKTFLAYMSEPSKFFGPGHPGTLQALEIATWDDYDEGTEMETGIDNCVSTFSSSLVGTTLSWTITFNGSGDESTIDHYTIFYSTDGATGENLRALTDVAAVGSGTSRSYSFTLPTTLPATTAIYVKAVGKPMLQNHMTAGVICTVCGSTVIVRPTTDTTPSISYSEYSNPTFAFDTSTTTYASGPGITTLSGEEYSGFSFSGTPTAINLKVNSAATNGGSGSLVGVWYSADGGNTSTWVYYLTPGNCFGDPKCSTASSRSQQTDTISLPANTTLSNVIVEVLTINGGGASQQVYDIWMEITR